MPVQLYFRKTGQGPALLILHGLFGSSDNWMSVAKKLEVNYTLFIPDLRNHGQSSHTPTHTYRDMVDDLELFFKTNKIEKATILGHSMGGKLAMMFAGCFPEKVNSLIVADIAPKSYSPDKSAIKNNEQNELIISIMDELDLSTVSSRKEIDLFLSLKLKEIGLRQFLMKNIYRNKEGQFKWKINVTVLKDSLETIIRDVNTDWFNSLKPIRNYPVTFIRGLNSDYILNKDIADIKTIYPEAKIIDIPEAGHWLHAEQPKKFVDAVFKLSSVNHS